MSIDWYTFTAAEWAGFTPDQWKTFVPYPEYDPIRVWSEAYAVFARPHVTDHYTAAVAWAVWKKRATNTTFRSAAESAAWNND